MIHGKMYGLYYQYGFHYRCGMTLTCNGASLRIWTGTSHMDENIAFHKCECIVEIKHLIWWLIIGLDTIGQSPTKSHGYMTWKNLCRVIERRARHSLG